MTDDKHKDVMDVEKPKMGLASTKIVDAEAKSEAECEACDVCYWNGVAYSLGARICNDRERLECKKVGEGTRWVRTGRC